MPATEVAMPTATAGAAMGTCTASGLLAIYALFVVWAHRWLIGVAPFPGLSLGGYVAFEIVRRAREAAETVPRQMQIAHEDEAIDAGTPPEPDEVDVETRPGTVGDDTEGADAPATPFDEVWHLRSGAGVIALAGTLLGIATQQAGEARLDLLAAQ